MVEYLLFLLFVFLLFSSAFMVAIATGINPVYSVFYLILCFCNVSCLFLLIGVDFLALLFLMIYVGAVAVLFLFVVMMVDLKRTQSTTVFNQFGSLFAVLLVLFLIVLSYVSSEAVTIFSSSDFQTNYFMYSESLDDLNSFYRLGEFLYVHGIYLFLISGVILLVAMVGCISLTQTREL